MKVKKFLIKVGTLILLVVTIGGVIISIKEKKESESLEHVNKYFATESDLPKEVLSRLGGMYNGKKTRRDAIASPYVYGLDVDALTMMKQYYTTRYPDCTTPYSIATLDTEVDIDTNTLIIISVACEEEIYVAILADFVQNRSDIDRQLNYLFKNNIQVRKSSM